MKINLYQGLLVLNLILRLNTLNYGHQTNT